MARNPRICLKRGQLGVSPREVPAKRLEELRPMPSATTKKKQAAGDAYCPHCHLLIERKVGELFEHRHLFVQRQLSPSERKTLRRITRGLPQLRALRSIMEEVDRLFDRRCRTDTALEKLTRLRRRVRRFRTVGPTLQELFSPNLEKSLTFLDDRLLGATSNAVERGNRRYRKMQKTVYRVRTREHIIGRIALDMLREWQAEGRAKTTKTLHRARAA